MKTNFNTFTAYHFNAETNEVTNIKTGKVIAWEASGKIRLTVNGERARYTLEDLKADLIVETAPKAKVNVAAEMREEVRKLIAEGKDKDDAWFICRAKFASKIARPSDIRIVFNRAFRRVTGE